MQNARTCRALLSNVVVGRAVPGDIIVRIRRSRACLRPWPGYDLLMPVLRRISAALVLLLQFAVGARPFVAVGQLRMDSAGHHHVAAAMVPDCHRAEAAPSPSADEHHGHLAGADADHEASPPSEAPANDTSPADHGSHTDAGCHGPPCCAPVVPTHVIRTIDSRDVPVARQRPNTGAARIVFADGARRRPPATAPPAV